MHQRALTASLVTVVLAGFSSASFAQVTLKPDGKWRSLVTLGANATSGNSNTLNVNLSGEAARVRARDKWTVNGLIAYGRNNGVVGTERGMLGTQYNRDISTASFSFGSANALRDEPANVSSRYSVAGGFGRHIYKSDNNTFDLSTGLGYSLDHYAIPKEVLGETRSSYGRLELVLAEESSHKLTSTTSLRQKFTAYPNLRDTGNFRAVFDAGLTVAMTPEMNLTAGLNYRHDSDPGAGVKKGDASFVTGVSYRFD